MDFVPQENLNIPPPTIYRRTQTDGVCLPVCLLLSVWILDSRFWVSSAGASSRPKSKLSIWQCRSGLRNYYSRSRFRFQLPRIYRASSGKFPQRNWLSAPLHSAQSLINFTPCSPSWLIIFGPTSIISSRIHAESTWTQTTIGANTPVPAKAHTREHMLMRLLNDFLALFRLVCIDLKQSFRKGDSNKYRSS